MKFGTHILLAIIQRGDLRFFENSKYFSSYEFFEFFVLDLAFSRCYRYLPYAVARHVWCGTRASYPGHIACCLSPCVSCHSSLIQRVKRHTREPNVGPGT